MTAARPLRCNCRRQEETHLRCARCDAPICPNCSVTTPTGMICRDCGSPKQHARFQVTGAHLSRALLACLAAAAPLGWLLTAYGISFGFFGLWGAFLYGGLTGEVALRATGRRRGTEMEIVAGASAALGLIFGWLLVRLPIPPEAGIPPLPVSPYFYAMAAIAVFAAVARVRHL